MADKKIRRVATAALLAAVPVIGFATPAAAQPTVPWHQSGAGGTLHQGSVPWHQGSVPWHQGSVPWHQNTSGSVGSDATDASVFDARF